jgi:outer membrane protein TolC
VSGGYNYIENTVLRERDYWSVALGVRWTPFDGGKARHATAALELQSTATAAEYQDVALAIELDVRRAWHARAAARARLALAAGAVAQADENLRVVRDRYRNGEGTNTEVLDAEALRTSGLSNRDTARYDATLADIELTHAIGGL